jgi:hypothetical protein
MVIDTSRMTYSYFRVPYLISMRVYTIIFDPYDSNSVWIWGKNYLVPEADGIVRYDRKNKTFQRYIYATKKDHKYPSYTKAWSQETYITVQKDVVVIQTDERKIYLNKHTGKWSEKDDD